MKIKRKYIRYLPMKNIKNKKIILMTFKHHSANKLIKIKYKSHLIFEKNDIISNIIELGGDIKITRILSYSLNKKYTKLKQINYEYIPI